MDASPTPAIQLPANTLELGSEIEIHAFGNVSTTGAATFTFGFYYGGVAGVALAASTAQSFTTAVSWPWIMHYRGVVRAIGSTGSINGQGILHIPNAALTSFTVRPIPETLAARTVTVDTTTLKSLTFGSACGTSNAANIMVCNDISVKLVT